MLRTVLQSLLLLLVLVASVEGTIDRASAGHPHGNELLTSLPSLISTTIRKLAIVTKAMAMLTVNIAATGHTSGSAQLFPQNLWIRQGLVKKLGTMIASEFWR